MGRYDHLTDEEKGFRRVSVTDPSEHRRQIGEAEEHGVLCKQVRREALLSGHLEVCLICRTPLHVSSGNMGHAASPFFRRGNQLVVPGSSLKGAFRSLFEAMTYSCLTLDPRSKQGDIPAAYAGCTAENEGGFCPACRVFGGLGYQGRVFFSEAVVLDNPQLYKETINQRYSHKPPSFVAERRIYYHRAPISLTSAPKEDIEVLPEGTQLRFEMDFTHLSCAELGLLLISLGQDRTNLMVVKLGGAKAAGFGAVSPIVTEAIIYVVPAERYAQFEREPFLRFEHSRESPYPPVFRELIEEAKSSPLYYAQGHTEIADALRYIPSSQ